MYWSGEEDMHMGVLLPELTHRLVKIKEWVESRDPQATVIPFSGALELKVYSFLMGCGLVCV